MGKTPKYVMMLKTGTGTRGTEEPHVDTFFKVNKTVDGVCKKDQIIKHITFSRQVHEHDVIQKKTGEILSYTDIEILDDNGYDWRRASDGEVARLLKVEDETAFTEMEFVEFSFTQKTTEGEGGSNRRLRR